MNANINPLQLWILNNLCYVRGDFRKNVEELLKFQNKEIYDIIIELTKFLDKNINFEVRLNHILYNLYEIPKCHWCGKELIVNRKTNWYNKVCSEECRRAIYSRKFKKELKESDKEAKEILGELKQC